MSFFNTDGSLSEEGIKTAKEAKARGGDRIKRARRNSGSNKSRRFNYFQEE